MHQLYRNSTGSNAGSSNGTLRAPSSRPSDNAVESDYQRQRHPRAVAEIGTDPGIMLSCKDPSLQGGAGPQVERQPGLLESAVLQAIASHTLPRLSAASVARLRNTSKQLLSLVEANAHIWRQAAADLLPSTYWGTLACTLPLCLQAVHGHERMRANLQQKQCVSIPASHLLADVNEARISPDGQLLAAGPHNLAVFRKACDIRVHTSSSDCTSVTSRSRFCGRDNYSLNMDEVCGVWTCDSSHLMFIQLADDEVEKDKSPDPEDIIPISIRIFLMDADTGSVGHAARIDGIAEYPRPADISCLGGHIAVHLPGACQVLPLPDCSSQLLTLSSAGPIRRFWHRHLDHLLLVVTPSGSASGKFTVWDVELGRVVREATVRTISPLSGMQVCDFDADLVVLLFGSGSLPGLRVICLDTRTAVLDVPPVSLSADYVGSRGARACFSCRGHLAVIWHGWLGVWDTAKGFPPLHGTSSGQSSHHGDTRAQRAPHDCVKDMAWSPCGGAFPPSCGDHRVGGMLPEALLVLGMQHSRIELHAVQAGGLACLARVDLPGCNFLMHLGPWSPLGTSMLVTACGDWPKGKPEEESHLRLSYDSSFVWHSTRTHVYVLNFACKLPRVSYP